jgi:hypothetical protein
MSRFIIKLFFTILYLSFGYYSFSQKGDHNNNTYYSSGNIKEKVSLNQLGVKNGKAFFYSENGYLDSTVIFKNGKINGLKKIFHIDGDVIFMDYSEDSLIRHRVYNKFNKLKYESPLNLKRVPRTTFKFSSGRKYFDTKSFDTLIINKDVPLLNLSVYFPGAKVYKIDNYTYVIKDWKPQPNSNNGKFVVNIYQDIFAEAKILREEIIYVTLK